MKATQLTKLATAAFGARWKNALSEAANISREQLWRYETEVTPISEEAAATLLKAIKRQLEKQHTATGNLLKALA